MNYQILDTILCTDVQLPELLMTESTDNAIQVDKLCDQSRIGNPEWVHHWLDEGEIAISTGYVENDVESGFENGVENNYLVRFPDLADFIIHKNCKVIRYQSHDNLDELSLRHLLLDQIIPRVRGQQGHLALHASAVTLTSGKTILFVGESGAGKSTLAATCAQLGATVIADDCVLLRMGDKGPECFGNYPSLRLYPDSAQACQVHTSTDSWSEDTQKYHISLKASGLKADKCMPNESTNRHKPLGVDAIFLLDSVNGETGQDKINRVSGAGMLMSIIQQLFLVNPLEISLSSRHFSELSELVNRGLPVFNIQFSRHLDSRESLYKKIEETCHGL